MKIGLISAAHMHLDAYATEVRNLPGVTVSGLWDDNPERLARKSSEYGVNPINDLDRLIESSDAVIICAENAHHRALTERAAQAKKSVLCEKPLATSPDDAAAMVQVCQANGVSLMTAFPCRFATAFLQLHAMVANGDLGDILAVRGTNRGQCPGGWFVDKALSGGGAVMDHTVHVTDLLRVLLADECASVFCESDNTLLHGDFDDSGFLSLTFEQGAFATLDASWSRPPSFPTWGDVTLSVIGTEGTADADLFAQGSLLYTNQGGPRQTGWGSSTDKGLVRAWIDSLRTGAPPPVTGVDGLRTVEVVEAAYKSVVSHQNEPVLRRAV